MKRLVAIGMMACAATVSAMPEKAELAKAQPIVNELMKPLIQDFRAKRKSAKDVAETAVKYARESETEAAKFLLLKGAISYYVRGCEYDKAAEAVARLQGDVKDIPPDVIAEIISRAASRINAKNAPRLFSQYRAARAKAMAQKEMNALRIALVNTPQDMEKRREYAELLALLGEWDRALKEFSKLTGKTGEMARKESDGTGKTFEQAEFWWGYKAQSEEEDCAFKQHAVDLYRKALGKGELSGLKKVLAEKRMAQRGVTAATAEKKVEKTTAAVIKKEVENPVAENAAEIVSSKFRFEAKENVATMIFPNGETFEFAKCPAGKLDMLTSFEIDSIRTTSVKITRPFWFSKTYIKIKHCFALFPDNHPHKNLVKKFVEEKRGNEPVTIAFSDFCRPNGVLELLNKNFKPFLPKGYVVRLPSAAEYQYAYHANSKDSKDPFSSIAPPRELVSVIRGTANRWGISDLTEFCRFLDKIDPKREDDFNLVENNRYPRFNFRLRAYSDRPAAKDPLFWTEAAGAMSVCHPMGIPGRVLAHEDRPGLYHLVVGPDLVSEWKAKNKK